jgi:hypothetical protein
MTTTCDYCRYWQRKDTDQPWGACTVSRDPDAQAITPRAHPHFSLPMLAAARQGYPMTTANFACILFQIRTA